MCVASGELESGSGSGSGSVVYKKLNNKIQTVWPGRLAQMSKQQISWESGRFLAIAIRATGLTAMWGILVLLVLGTLAI